MQWWQSDDRWEHLQLTELQLSNMAQVHEYFRWFDVEGDGELNYEEFVQVVDYMRESGFEVEDANDILDEIDTTHDGKVNYNEFVVWMVGIGCLENANIQKVAQKHHEEALVRRESRRAMNAQFAQETDSQ